MNTEQTQPPASLAADGSEVEPLKSVEWQFPLGGCHARLTIVAAPENEILPEDMDALREMAALIKRQLERRAQRGRIRVKCGTCGGMLGDPAFYEGEGCKCPLPELPPNNEV